MYTRLFMNSPAARRRAVARAICSVANEAPNRAAARAPEICPALARMAVTNSVRVLCQAGNMPKKIGIFFGMFPAWHSTRTELVTAIRANAGQISGARAAARFGASLATEQIALATALLLAAGLFMNSLVYI